MAEKMMRREHEEKREQQDWVFHKLYLSLANTSLVSKLGTNLGGPR
jgi:hypothetical protein